MHPDFNVPTNKFGFTYPQDGERYAGSGLVGFNSIQPNVEYGRENLAVKMTSKLIKDSAYCVSFYYQNSNYIDGSAIG